MAREVVQQIYDEYDLRLPPHLRNHLQKHPKDPARLTTPQGLDEVRVRILPIQKSPLKFWNSSWCFYEIAAANLTGHVQFFQASNQKVCGGGRYRDQVEAILRDVQKLRPKDLNFRPIGGSSSYVHLARRFRASDQASWRPDVVADDLVWIIEKTLGRFQAL